MFKNAFFYFLKNIKRLHCHKKIDPPLQSLTPFVSILWLCASGHKIIIIILIIILGLTMKL